MIKKQGCVDKKHEKNENKNKKMAGSFKKFYFCSKI
jgi:hypothetical protein